jgi:5-methylcytosine-specific restriction endonuclease McrA
MPKAKKTAKIYNWDTKIVAAIRKVWRYSPERRACLDAARDPHEKKLVQCAKCLEYFNEKLVTVDHIEPCVPVTGFVSYDAFIKALKENSTQILCEECHSVKTKAENSLRTLHKRAKKTIKKRLSK